MTEATWLWLTLFSRLCHAIDSWQQTGSVKTQATENAIWDT